MLQTLDRYIIAQWLKVFLLTTIGFPLIVILIELTDKLDIYLSQQIPPTTIALAYIYTLPEKIFLVLPAAVLFATVFTLGSMNRHSELTAAKATGISFYRMIVPLFFASMLVVALGVVVGEMMPSATKRHLELLDTNNTRSQNSRQNFVYRADEGWVYTIRSLNVGQRRVNGIVLEREGTSAEYPTLLVHSRFGTYNDTTQFWTLVRGRYRVVTDRQSEVALQFDSLRMADFLETPSDLLQENKRPEEMNYRELGEYIEAFELSGGDGRRLKVGRALKLAVPVTCLIITLFAAPLVVAAPRASGALGVGIGLGTTLVFLLLVQLSQGIGGAGVLPPTVAAWTPNIIFAIAGLWLLKRAPT